MAIGLGTMMGAGIFVLSADAAQRAGPGAALSFIIAGLVVLPTAMVVSELVTAMPKAGGSYHLISRTLGPLAGALVGPANWLGLMFATGFYLIGFGQFVRALLPVPSWAVMLAAGVGFTALNYRGAKLTGTVQRLIVAALILLLAAFSVGGYFHIESRLHDPFLPEGLGGVLAAVGLIMVSFTGFEKISTVAEEVRKPERNLPLAIIGSVIIATVLYAAVLYVFTGIVPFDRIPEPETAMVRAGAAVFGSVGRAAMLIGGLLATASSANAAILASSRINFAMGRDHILPPWFDAIHPRHLTPHRSILVTGGGAIVLALTGGAPRLAEISSALFMISYALLTAGMIVMRQLDADWYRPDFRVPFFPWLPAAGGMAAIAVIFTMDRFSQLSGLGLVVLSLAWYVLWARRRTSVQGELGNWREKIEPLAQIRSAVGLQQEPEHTTHKEILVVIDEACPGAGLASLAVSLARGEEDQDVLLTRMIPVPDDLSLVDAEQFFLRRRPEFEDEVEALASEGRRRGIRIYRHFEVTRSPANSVVMLAEGRPSVRLILVGWHKSRWRRWLQATIDREIERRAPCDVAVLLDRNVEQLRRILVAADGSPHARLAFRLAGELRKACGVELLVIGPAGGRPSDGLPGIDVDQWLAETAPDGPDSPAVRMVEAERPAHGVMDHARSDTDLAVLSASPDGPVRGWLTSHRSEALVNRAPCSVLLIHSTRADTP